MHVCSHADACMRRPTLFRCRQSNSITWSDCLTVRLGVSWASRVSSSQPAAAAAAASDSRRSNVNYTVSACHMVCGCMNARRSCQTRKWPVLTSVVEVAVSGGQISNISDLFGINRKWTRNVYREKLLARFLLEKAEKSSNHFKCLSNGQHWIASAVAVPRSTVRALRLALLARIMAPHVENNLSALADEAGILRNLMWACEVSIFAISKSNRRSLNRIANRIIML